MYQPAPGFTYVSYLISLLSVVITYLQTEGIKCTSCSNWFKMFTMFKMIENMILTSYSDTSYLIAG